MTHFENIAAALKGRGLDAMLVTSEPGEFYAVGFHGEGAALITPDKTWYYTDSRYIEAARQLISGAEVDRRERLPGADRRAGQGPRRGQAGL